MPRSDHTTEQQAQHFGSLAAQYAWGDWMHTQLLTARYAVGGVPTNQDPEVVAWLDDLWDRLVEPLVNPVNQPE